MLRDGSRSQIGSNRPVMMWNSLSANSGTCGAFGLPQRRELALRSASRQCERAKSSSDIVSRAIGRTRRVRGCTRPSSSIRLAAGTCTAARCDCSLTSEPGA